MGGQPTKGVTKRKQNREEDGLNREGGGGNKDGGLPRGGGEYN